MMRILDRIDDLEIISVTKENKSDISILKWSGEFPIPAIGSTIRSKRNDLGTAVVLNYAIQFGYVGLVVLFDDPPKWYIEQNQGNEPAILYGAELDCDSSKLGGTK